MKTATARQWRAWTSSARPRVRARSVMASVLSWLCSCHCCISPPLLATSIIRTIYKNIKINQFCFGSVYKTHYDTFCLLTALRSVLYGFGAFMSVLVLTWLNPRQGGKGRTHRRKAKHTTSSETLCCPFLLCSFSPSLYPVKSCQRFTQSPACSPFFRIVHVDSRFRFLYQYSGYCS